MGWKALAAPQLLTQIAQMPPHARRLLLASIHDVSPRFESEVDQLIGLFDPHVGMRFAMLVVPNHWGEAPIVPGSPFATRLRHWAENGVEIFLHGYFHRDNGAHRAASDRLRSRFMTANEGEFLGLSRAEAAARIADGRALLEDVIGRAVDGFVAPAWLYGNGALEALRDAAVPLAEDHFHVWSPANGAKLASGPVITWASRTRLRMASSLAAAAAIRRVPLKVLRVGVHPPDVRHPALIRSIKNVLGSATRSRQPGHYSELLRI
jgi:predicted deacetylase